MLFTIVLITLYNLARFRKIKKKDHVNRFDDSQTGRRCYFTICKGNISQRCSKTIH